MYIYIYMYRLCTKNIDIYTYVTTYVCTYIYIYLYIYIHIHTCIYTYIWSPLAEKNMSLGRAGGQYLHRSSAEAADRAAFVHVWSHSRELGRLLVVFSDFDILGSLQSLQY